DDSFSTRRGGIVGRVPSGGKSTRCGPTAPMCRYADPAPGPPCKNKRAAGRSPSPRPSSRLPFDPCPTCPWSRPRPAARDPASSRSSRRSSCRRSWARRLPVVLRSRVRTTPDAPHVRDCEVLTERGGGEVSQIAVEKPGCRVDPVPTQAPGSAFLALMAGLWGAFVTLLAVSPSTLDDAYEWLGGLPIVWEVLMWLVT